MSQLAKGQRAFHAKPLDEEQNCEEIQNPISTLSIWKADTDIFFRELLNEGEINRVKIFLQITYTDLELQKNSWSHHRMKSYQLFLRKGEKSEM